MNARITVIAAALAALAGTGTAVLRAEAASASPSAPASGTGPVVVELFTSQGCSSCPPADALLGRLAREAGILAISRPVTHWDRLGWKDTLALPANTDLQRAYAARKLPGGGVYTPGAVVQGRAGTVGSNEPKLRHLIAAARKAQGPALTVNGNRLTVGAGTGSGTIELLKLRPKAEVAVASGENEGRRIHYINVVTAISHIGHWDGKQTSLALPRDALSSGRAAILLRQGKAGPILAARSL